MTARLRVSILALLAGLLAVQVGCSGSPAVAGGDKQLRSVMQVLGQVYGTYLGTHDGKPPADEAAFRAYLQAQLGELAMYHVKSADDLLVKGRDGEPLVIVCGEKIVDPQHPDYPWAAYEKAGVGGTRLAVNTRGGVSELGEQEFAAQVPIK